MKGILFRLKKEAMMGAGKLDLKRMMIWLVAENTPISSWDPNYY